MADVPRRFSMGMKYDIENKMTCKNSACLFLFYRKQVTILKIMSIF